MNQKDKQQYEELLCLGSQIATMASRYDELKIATMISRHDELADDLRQRANVPCKKFKDRVTYVQTKPLELQLSV